MVRTPSIIGPVLIAGIAGVGMLRADGPPDRGKAQPASPRAAADPAASRADLEKNFRQMLAGSVLKGSWQMTRGEGLEGKAPLDEPREDTYTIDSVQKSGENYWVITARIQYADKDVRIPVPVRVEWAGDTPIIALDNIGLPGLGTYSARVMVYRNFYAGTWFGKGYGGVMSGQITKQTSTRPSD